MEREHPHIPVLLCGNAGHDVLEILRPREGEKVLDATVGLGGHSEAFLKAIGSSGVLTAVDADEENLSYARERLKEWKNSCRFIHANFRTIGALGLGRFSMIFADLGVSSPHFDDPDRGFSFRFDAPLDLRFDRKRGVTAAAFLKESSEEQIHRVLKEYGEVQNAQRLASVFYGEARHRPTALNTTAGLRTLVERTFGFRAKELLPQIFQALRIAVNDELAALGEFLEAAPSLLEPGGRLGIISFHSLEDRMVKKAFKEWSTPQKDPVTGEDVQSAPFSLLTPKAIVPSEREARENPRARSAKFRAVRKLDQSMTEPPVS